IQLRLKNIRAGLRPVLSTAFWAATSYARTESSQPAQTSAHAIDRRKPAQWPFCRTVLSRYKTAALYTKLAACVNASSHRSGYSMPQVTPLAILCQTAKFIKSASQVDQCPADQGLEVAF